MKGGKQSSECVKGQSLNYQHVQLQNLLPRPWLQQFLRLHDLCGISWDFASLWPDPALTPGIPLAAAGGESFLPALVALLWKLVMSDPSLCC